MALPLKAAGNNNGKQSYTEAEKNLAHICVSMALIFAEFECPKPKMDATVEQQLDLIKSEHNSVDTLCRALFRGFIKDMCGSGKDFHSSSDFPKERDPTSVQLLMRTGLIRCGREDIIDEVFHRYSGKKKEA